MPDPEATGAYKPPPPAAAERFAPGAVLSGRYRVVAPLGSGGMGEVYRADDLTLGQPVALKFLPAHLVANPDRLARFRKEVAAARRVSHPNVCRVYDLADLDGQPFLTMEFIDGEDLGSVLRRMGRMTEEKGLEVARQLCSALAAVHEQGLLHRDLKPANVMLDGRGKVRLTDFGLAAAAEELSGAEVRSGTPLYQAPEQLAGLAVTARSDVYALGLVLYELFTGRRAFPDVKRDTPPGKPRSHVSNLNPAVEAVILRCLEPDPASRPRSAAEVLAGLPGGDPLAAALAAGETPSPQIVADAGGSGIISVRTGLLLFTAVVLSAALTALAADQVGLPQRAGMTEPPEAMTRKARDVLASLGHRDAPADSVGRYEPNWEWIAPARRSDPEWYRKAGGRPGGVLFFYRGSPEPMGDGDQTVSWTSPPPVAPGTALVRLDPRGRLVELQVVPPARPDGPPTAAGAEWATPLFAAAGLDPARFAPSEPDRTPPVGCDAQAAWAGTWGDGEASVRVEAAAYRGRPVWFRIDHPGIPAGPTERRDAPPVWVTVLLLAVMGLGGLLAWRNVRRGRGDRVTARRLAVAILGYSLFVWVVRTHHSGAVFAELNTFTIWLGSAAFAVGAIVGAYLALEPSVRRRWPWRLTGWTRLFAGRWRDPMVGRDLLVGLAVGAGVTAAAGGLNWAGAAAGLPVPGPVHPYGPGLTAVNEPGDVLGNLMMALLAPVFQLFLVFVVFLVVRREWAAWVGYVIILLTVWWGRDLSHCAPAVMPALAAVGVANALAVAFLLARFGPLAASGYFIGLAVLPAVPLTTDPSAWYFARGAVPAVCLLALAGFCCWTATGSKRLFKEGFFGDD